MREIKFKILKIDLHSFLYDEGRTILEIGIEDLGAIRHNPKNYLFIQYVGRKDKNGKEIYEGDILKDDNDELFEVKFGKLPLDKSGDCVCDYSAFYAKGLGKLGQQPFHECNKIGYWMKVISNIYENPEFLKWEAK